MATLLAIAKWLLGLFMGPAEDAAKDARQRADQIALGEARQEATDQAAAVAAEKTIQDAQAEPRGRDVTQGALDDGKF